MLAYDLLAVVEVHEAKVKDDGQIGRPVEVGAVCAHELGKEHERDATTRQVVQMLIVIVMQIVVVVGVNGRQGMRCCCVVMMRVMGLLMMKVTF